MLLATPPCRLWIYTRLVKINKSICWIHKAALIVVQYCFVSKVFTVSIATLLHCLEI